MKTRSAQHLRPLLLLFTASAVACLVAAGPAIAAGPPSASTNAATNVTATSATLEGTVFPNQNDTTYYFEYGTTTAYGTQTPTQGPVGGNAGKSANADVTGLTPSTTYHFRVVAVNSAGTSVGNDMTFTTLATGGGPGAQNAVTIGATPTTVTFGRATTIAGQVTGPGNTGVQVTLEEDPFPFGDGFKATTLTATTDASGNYTLTVIPSLNTHYRVAAKTSPPVTSGEVAVNVRVKVSLRLSDSTPAVGQVVRFSGLVSPAHNGKTVQIQRRTSTGRYRTIATTTLVATTPAKGVERSKFAKRIRVRSNGLYRARVAPGDGDHVTGLSARRRATVH